MRYGLPGARVAFLTALLTLGACGGDAPATDETADTEAPAAEAPAPAGDVLLDPETATRDQLMAIQGIDGVLADALVAARPFGTMLDVDAVLAASLDEAQREEVYRHLWKPLDLNTASAEEILLIPGVGDRMLHEFEEYRPYSAMAEFSREMGKYVDDEEVARLERYVTIR